MTQITEIRFNGLNINLVGANGTVVSSATAVSGRPLLQNPIYSGLPDGGPLPEGTYIIRQENIESRFSFDDPNNIGWNPGFGNHRVTLIPDGQSDMQGRDGFFLHGSNAVLGNGWGSAGCIDLGTYEEGIFHTLRTEGADEIIVVVEYDESLSDGYHPVFVDEYGTSDLRQAEIEAVRAYVDANPQILTDEDYVRAVVERFGPDIIEELLPDRYCFLPGTPITLSDGVTIKPIEEIGVGDEVLSYTGDGTLVPGRVTATSSKTASIVLDWFGLGVTPGHVTLCGVVSGEEDTASGPFMGRHVPLIDILCADGAVVRQEGSLVRAGTNEPVGSRADAFVHLAYSRNGEELKAGVSHEASIRVGTKLITGEGNTVRVLDVIEANGYAFDEETGLVSRPLDDGTPGVPGPLPFFGMPPKPEDHVLARSGTTLEAIHTAGEWEGEGSQLPAPTPARATPPAAMSPPMNRKQRRALMAKGRRAH